MPHAAQVRSTQSIEDLRNGLARFESRAQAAIEALDAELGRADQWIEHIQPAYWKQQLRQAEDAHHQSKIKLEHCLMFPVVEGERPKCREEKDDVRRAKQRVELCREQAEAVRTWRRRFVHETHEYQGRMGQLRRQLESDLPRAKARLKKLLERLAEYAAQTAPHASKAPNESHQAQSVSEDK